MQVYSLSLPLGAELVTQSANMVFSITIVT